MPSVSHSPHTPMPMSLRHRFSLKRFFSGEGPEAGPVFLAQRRVYILPSKMGVYFATMLLVMLLGAVNYNNSLGYILVFLLASVFFIAILHTYRNLLHLRVDVGHTAAVFCGETAQVPILLDNHQNPARYAIKLWLGRMARKKSDQQPTQHITSDIRADQQQRVTVPLPTTQRGLHNVPRLTLETGFPLGLFRAWAYAQRDVQHLVYPTPEQHHKLRNQPSYHPNMEGDRGHGTDDFVGLRNYHSGDSLRHVHWKTVARGQGMYSKQFGGDRAVELWLDWDSLPQLDTEARLSRLTRWVLDASAQQLNYGLRLPGTQIPFGSGMAHQHRCLQALAMFDHRHSATAANNHAPA